MGCTPMGVGGVSGGGVSGGVSGVNNGVGGVRW